MIDDHHDTKILEKSWPAVIYIQLLWYHLVLGQVAFFKCSKTKCNLSNSLTIIHTYDHGDILYTSPAYHHCRNLLHRVPVKAKSWHIGDQGDTPDISPTPSRCRRYQGHRFWGSIHPWKLQDTSVQEDMVHMFPNCVRSRNLPRTRLLLVLHNWKLICMILGLQKNFVSGPGPLS